ncbi:hypothetical protein HA051_02825 [Chromobacterium vaccinii]|nr:hypothetical protein [Chromobacterium vaccinii]
MKVYLSEYEKSELNAQLPEFFENAFGMGVGALWCQIDDSLTLEKRRQIFLYVLQMLFNTGRVFWGAKGVLVSEFEKVLHDFEMSWPDCDVFDDDNFNTVLPYWDDGKLKTDVWIVGDLVWVGMEGELLWSTDSIA